MDVTEVMNWVAYFNLKDDDYRKKLSHEVELENQKDNTADQEAQAMLNMFMGIQNASNK